jgi:hypothetical protein
MTPFDDLTGLCDVRQSWVYRDEAPTPGRNQRAFPLG